MSRSAHIGLTPPLVWLLHDSRTGRWMGSPDAAAVYLQGFPDDEASALLLGLRDQGVLARIGHAATGAEVFRVIAKPDTTLTERCAGALMLLPRADRKTVGRLAELDALGVLPYPIEPTVLIAVLASLCRSLRENPQVGAGSISLGAVLKSTRDLERAVAVLAGRQGLPAPLAFDRLRRQARLRPP